jgi:hypothetical protein
LECSCKKGGLAATFGNEIEKHLLFLHNYNGFL